MMLDKYIYGLSKNYLENLYYDRCHDISLLDRYMLFAKISCEKNQSKVDKTLKTISKLCQIPTTPCTGIRVIKDDSLNVYIANPDCISLPLWEIKAKDIKFMLNVVTTIKSLDTEKAIMVSYIKNNIKEVLPNLKISNKKISDSKNNIKISFKKDNVKTANFDLNIKSFTNDLEANNLQLALKHNIAHITECSTDE